MDADGVEVLHIANGDRGVVSVANDLVLDLLISLDALFYQNLFYGRERKPVFEERDQFLLVVREAAARAAEGKCGTQNDGIADLRCDRDPLFDVVCDVGGKDGFADALTELFEKVAIFRLLDGRALGAEKLRTAFRQYPFLLELHGDIEPCLSADAREDGVGTLVANDLGEVLQGQRLHIHFVRDGLVGHDGGGVGIHEHDLVAFLFERETRLRACVVEFRRLSDDDGTRTDHEDLMNIRSLRHSLTSP